jgi:hypothetical protein
MSNARAEFISLVDRGANRTPFHIIRQENGMSRGFMRGLDISSVLTRKSEAPTVVGIATLKGDSFESVKSLVKESGFDTEQVVDMEDGSVVFKQEADLTNGQGTIVRMNGTTAVIMKGYTPYDMKLSINDVEFKDLVAAQGYYPGIAQVMSDTTSAIFDTVSKAESPAEAAKAVSSMLEEVKKYVTSMAEALPSNCFKLETAEEPEVEEEVKEEEVVKEEVKTDPVEEPKTEEVPTTEVVKEEVKEEVKEVPVAGLTEESVSGIVAKQMERMSGDLLKLVSKSVSDAISPVTESVSKMADQVKAIGDKVEKQETVLKGVVVQGGDADDTPPAPVKKTERAGRDFDTAYNPQVRTRRK